MSEITRDQAIQIVEDIRTAISAGSVTNTMEAQVLEYCVSVLGRRIEEASLSEHIENLPDVAAFLAGISPSATLKALLEGITDAVEVINANIGNGYVYAGIATPSGTPVSGKVFYLAKQAGQYANFGGLTVTEGVNILKRNGSTWTQEQLLSMADIRKNPLIGYYECDTAGDTSAKTVTAAGYVLPATGGSVKIKMANRNTVANATLNINSTGAKPLYYNGQRAGVGNTWDTNEIIEVFYDGAKYQAYNVAGSNGDGVFDISAYNLTDGQPTSYEDLAAALGPNGDNVPLSLRKGGMSIKFVKSSDNKYIQCRLTADEFTTDITKWQNVGDFLKEKEISYSEEDVAGYITDKKGIIVGRLMKSGAVEWTVKNGRDILLDGKISDIENSIQGISGNLNTQTERIDELDENTIREIEIDDTEENVAAYITDKKKAIIAKINKDGSIDRLVENDKDKHTVHFENIDIDGIIGVLSDKNKNVIASINNKAEVYFYGGGGFAGEKIVEAKTWGYSKLIVSKNNLVIGGIKEDGTVKIFKAEIENIADTQATKMILNTIPLIAAGIDNIDVSRSKKMQKLLTSVNSSLPIEINGVNIGLHPCLSIIDDDTSDDYIPSSQGREIVEDNPVGGFFSLLLPLLLSLGDKHGKKLVAGLACEGHRVGLTTFHNDSDTYSQLNTNGQLVKQLVEHEGWDVLNHSMAASIPTTGRTYGVESINSEVANTILANGTYVGYRSFHNTMVLELSTGKWYQVNSTCTAWEEVNGQKYGQMYYQDYTTGEWFVNRNFDWEYNWGEWFKRAKELGLPFIKQIVHNGSTCTPVSILQSRRYAYCSYDIGGNYNVPPTCAAIKRRSGVEDNTSTNVPSSGWKARFLAYVDSCIADNGWMPLMVHFSEERFFNGYREGKDYENKDIEYEVGGSKYEWIHPLTENEILSMDANNYWINPPARLNISSWSEWIPASGTQLRVLYDVLDYALSNGVEIVSPSAGWDEFGNIIQFGVDRNGQTFTRDADLKNQYSDAEKSYLTIGADECIRYFSK